MVSNLMCASEGAPISSDFKNTVRISTDLSVSSVSLVNSSSTLGWVSRNFAVRVRLLVFMVICILTVGCRLWKLCQYSREKTPQLVEVVRKCEMNVLSDSNLVTLGNSL